jgi:hypothetical protein
MNFDFSGCKQFIFVQQCRQWNPYFLLLLVISEVLMAVTVMTRMSSRTV